MTHRNSSNRFKFGENWQNFNEKHFSDDRVKLAIISLKELLCLENLFDKTFLDIGCGSGLFSLAAYELGAKKVFSFDYDPDSVDAAKKLRTLKHAPTDKWQIECGSILDNSFIQNIKPADVVYSWGVLHHTGDMWNAIDNAANKVIPGGILAISIYNKVDRSIGGSNFWHKIKRTYVKSPRPLQFFIEILYVLNFLFRHLLTFRNPFKEINQYRFKRNRGMSFWHDVRDWVGGYPYEFATAGEIFNYLHKKHSFELKHLTTTHSVGCNQFLFQRSLHTS